MELSLQNIACAVGLALMISGLIGAWVETRLKVKTLMRESVVAEKRYRDCRTQQFSKTDELLASMNDLRHSFTESIGEVKTSLGMTQQKLDDLIHMTKSNGGGKHA